MSSFQMDNKLKIIRSSTIPESLDAFCKGILKELSFKYEVIALSSPGEVLEKLATREGVRSIGVPMERRISLRKDIKSLMQMISVFKKEKPYAVHSMTPKAGLVCMMAGWLTGVPVRIHTFTGLVWPTSKGIKRRLLMFTDALTCACATHIIPEGEGVKNDLVSGRITKKHMRVLGYGNIRGVDMEYYSKRDEVIELMKSENLRDETKFTFLFVGRVVRDKGVNELVAAFNRLSKEILDLRLFLVGSYEEGLDPISDDCRDLIENNPSIFAVGTKTGDELLAYYCASDCFVLPSYREGFPNSVLEAGAMGLPCIVTDINGSREIIKEGENGLVIPPCNEEMLYKAMREIIESKEEREMMANRSRIMIGSRFEQRFVRKCLYDFYDEIFR